MTREGAGPDAEEDLGSVRLSVGAWGHGRAGLHGAGGFVFGKITLQ